MRREELRRGTERDRRLDSLLRHEIRLALGRYGLGSSIEQALVEIGPGLGVRIIGEVTREKVALLLESTTQPQETR